MKARVANPWRVWGWPVAMAVLSASGLATALVSDHWGDAWSWIGLGVPVVVIGWFGWLRPAARRRPPFRNDNHHHPAP